MAQNERLTHVPDLPKLLSVSQVAERFSMSRSAIWRLVWNGDLPSYRLGERVVRLDPKDVHAYLLERRSA